MFSLWIYSVPVITRFVFDASPPSIRYTQALVAVSACFALYAVLGASLAFALPWCLARVRAGIVHGSALIIGGTGLSSLAFAHQPFRLIPAFVAIGVAWSSISNIPYAVAAAAAPVGRGAFTLRVFGFSTVAPQVVMTTALALLSPRLPSEPSPIVMLVGGCAMAAGGIVSIALHRRLDVANDRW